MSVASTLDSVVSNPTTDSLRPNRRTAGHFGCIDGVVSVNAKARRHLSFCKSSL